MRYLLWAGQKILFGLWILAWPYFVWRWARQARFIPQKRRRVILLQCVTGTLIGCIFLTLAVVCHDLGWLYDGLYMYIPIALYQLRKTRVLARRYGLRHKEHEPGKLSHRNE